MITDKHDKRQNLMSKQNSVVQTDFYIWLVSRLHNLLIDNIIVPKIAFYVLLFVLNYYIFANITKMIFLRY